MFRRFRTWFVLARGALRIARGVCPQCASGALAKYSCAVCQGWSEGYHHGLAPEHSWKEFKRAVEKE